MTGFTCI